MPIIPLTPAHLDAYRTLMLEAYAAEADAFTSTPQERAAEPDAWWARRLADPAGLTACLGAFHQGQLAGTVTLEFSARSRTLHKGHLAAMYVKPGARGAGLGRQLVQAAITHARARPGMQVLTLTVTQGNAAAESLYISCGFQAFGVEPMAIRTEAGCLAKVHMWLALHDGQPA
jgi:ribosomal protein S18 acetylase RimI-like enzyme